MGDGAFAIHLVDRHFFAIGIVPANRRVDDALRRRSARRVQSPGSDA